ncbi:hypothetical protein [Paraliobacillus sediminis]|uniref:hypothetical protein n=1 Tax=Paraliobacillus sediminis TaxID=1885916 RepID=UPI000E3C1380|nr:hypothetical protein [Paraliobacillus sediminis]
MDQQRLDEIDLEKKLNKMPKVKDQQSKEILYNKIQQELNTTPKSKQNRSWVIPSLALIAALSVVFIFIRSTNTTLFDNADQIESSEDSFTSQEQNISGDTSEESVGLVETEVNIESMLYYHEIEQEQTFTLTVADQNYQYAIPITLVDASSTGEPNDYYNRINSYVEDLVESVGIKTFPFEDIVFEFIDNKEQLFMTVPNAYQFPNGSSNAIMFQQMLDFMFTPYGISEINVQTESADPVDLGPYGVIDKFPLRKITNQVYKIYQYEDLEKLLIPTSVNEIVSINEALTLMQLDEGNYIKAPIPKDVFFNAEDNGKDEMIISFSESNQFSNNQRTASMIEAILITAKTFGYSSVVFDIPIDSDVVGEYRLHESIPVPDGVNPLVLH